MTGIATARLLGYAGLLPFLGAAAGIWLAPGPVRAVSFLALGTYGAVILSFLGAVHWGRMLAEPAPETRAWYAWSVLPALIGWVALLLPPAFGLSVLTAGFLLAWLVDRGAAARGHLPGWYGRLRAHLTAGVLLSLAVSIPAFL